MFFGTFPGKGGNSGGEKISNLSPPPIMNDQLVDKYRWHWHY